MKEHQSIFAVEKMSKVFNVSRSGYYQWLNRKPSQRSVSRHKLTQLVKEIYYNSKCRYGSPKISKELRNSGITASRQLVARIMQSLGIRSIINRKYRPATTDSNHKLSISPNRLNREFAAHKPGQKWVSDLTYIPIKGGWCYLTVILDLYDRRVVGWSLSKGMAAQQTVIAAFEKAKRNRPITQKLLFHSDRGIQYAAREFRDRIGNMGITQSMSRKGNCWDNAVAESFFKILKSELVKRRQYQTIEEARKDIFYFIEIWYHRKRIHSALNYLTPEQFLIQNMQRVA